MSSPAPRSPIVTRSKTIKRKEEERKEREAKQLSDHIDFFENNTEVQDVENYPRGFSFWPFSRGGGKRRKTYRRKSSSKKSLKTRYNRRRR